MKLIKFLSSGDASTTFSKENSLVPILKSAADDPFYKTGPWASYVTMNEYAGHLPRGDPAARRRRGGPSGATRPTPTYRS